MGTHLSCNNVGKSSGCLDVQSNFHTSRSLVAMGTYLSCSNVGISTGCLEMIRPIPVEQFYRSESRALHAFMQCEELLLQQGVGEQTTAYQKAQAYPVLADAGRFLVCSNSNVEMICSLVTFSPFLCPDSSTGSGVFGFVTLSSSLGSATSKLNYELP